MKFFKQMIVVVGILVTIPFVAALFMKKEIKVQSEVIIQKPRKDVFNYLKYVKNQQNFSRWATVDPQMKKEYLGNDGTPGFIYRWESENLNLGKGEQEITNIIDGKRIDFEFRFQKPATSTNSAYLVTEPAGSNDTRVVWGYSGTMRYPMNVMIPFLGGTLEKDLHGDLEKLKRILERNL